MKELAPWILLAFYALTGLIALYDLRKDSRP
jgi:hypothetical protein